MKEEIKLPTMEQLKIFKNCEVNAIPTDFYIIERGYLTFTGNGYYWTKTSHSNNKSLITIDHRLSDYISYPEANETNRGVCPVISLSENDIKENTFNKFLRIEEIEYGEYPQTLAYSDIGEELENLYQHNKLEKTNKIYTSMKEKVKQRFKEYIYQGDKYVRIKTKNKINWPCTSSTKYINPDKKTFWVKVEPITWIVDKQEKIAISKNILAVMPFSYNNDNNYEKSDIKKFLENYFIKEIQTNKVNENIDIEKINDLIDLMSMLYPKNQQKEKSKVKIYNKDIRG